MKGLTAFLGALPGLPPPLDGPHVAIAVLLPKRLALLRALRILRCLAISGAKLHYHPGLVHMAPDEFVCT